MQSGIEKGWGSGGDTGFKDCVIEITHDYNHGKNPKSRGMGYQPTGLGYQLSWPRKFVLEKHWRETLQKAWFLPTALSIPVCFEKWNKAPFAQYMTDCRFQISVCIVLYTIKANRQLRMNMHIVVPNESIIIMSCFELVTWMNNDPPELSLHFHIITNPDECYRPNYIVCLNLKTKINFTICNCFEGHCVNHHRTKKKNAYDVATKNHPVYTSRCIES